MALGSEGPSDRVSIGLVGGGKGGSALLDLILDWPVAKVAVVVDPRPEAPALGKARALGIPTAAHHLEVFAHPVDLVLEVTGQPAVLEDLLRAKPPGVEVIGAGSLRFFWNLLQDKARATRQLSVQLDMAMMLGSTLDVKDQIALVTQRLAQACGVDRCTIFFWNEATGFVTRVVPQFATGEPNGRMWNAFKGLGPLKLVDVPFLYEVMERRGPVEIDDPASNSLYPHGWADLFETKSVLVLPIFRKNQVVGACVLDYCRAPHRFEPDQAALAIALASQVSLALDNARLYQRAEERAEKLATLSMLTRLITGATDSQQVFHAVAKAAVTLLGARSARVWVADPEDRVLRMKGSFGIDPKFEQAMTDFSVIPYGRGVVGGVFESRAPGYVLDVQQDSRVLNPQLVKDAGLRAFAGLPLITGDRVVGLLSILFGDRRQFTPEEKELMGLLADQAAIAIENARLYEETERRRRAAEGLANLGRLISQSLDPEEVGQRIVDSVRKLLGAQMSALYRLEPSGDLVGLAVSTDVGRVFDWNRILPPGTGLVGLAVQERRPVVTPDLLSDPRVTLTPEARARVEQGPFRGAVAVPLIVQDTVIGALAVGDRAGRVFDGEEIRLAQAFAAQVALALENSRLYAEATRRGREAEELARVARTLTESLDVLAVGERIAESVLPLFGVQSSVLRLLQPDGSLVVVASSGSSRDYFEPGHVLPSAAGGVTGRAMAEGRSVWSRDALSDPGIVFTDEMRRRVAASGNRAALAVPLRVKGKTTGTLTIADRAVRAFSEAEVALLQAFADQAALALENARLFEEQVRLTEETRRQHQEAVALEEGAREITSSLERGEVFQRIVDRARELCRSDLAFLAPHDREARTARIVAASGARTEALMAVTITPGRGTGGKVLETGEPFTTEDYLTDPRITKDYAEAAIQEGFVSQAVVPLRFRGATTGLLWVVNRTPRRFTPQDLAVLTQLADQAAIALENSRLYGELRVALEEVEASQQRIVQTERLRALGEMAAGVAHDFNNLLAVILGRAELLLARTREPEVARALEAVRTAALDGAQTVRRIQEFTRTRRTRPFGRVDLWELLSEVVELTRPRWKNEAQSRGVTYAVRVEGGPVPPVAGIAEELREVFTNLLINALEAMPAGGRFIFRLTSKADSVVVIAEDTGCGMSEETCLRVFEPFFTTKGPRGTGLGLAVAWGIISRHGGTIEVKSTLGAGSTFTIRFPIGQEIPSEEKPAPPPRPARGVRVLVIDDEPEVRAVMRDLLTERGYTVIEATDGAEGLARCEAEPVDLVLSDLSMPEMSGWEVAATCRERFPGVPVGFMTGWGDQLDPDQLERYQVRFVLAKPFVASDVLRQVARALTTTEAV